MNGAYARKGAVATYISRESTNVSKQLAFEVERFPTRARKRLWKAVQEVGQYLCAHGMGPPRRLYKGNAAARTRKSGGGHQRLSGLHHSGPALSWKMIIFSRRKEIGEQRLNTQV